MSECVYVEERGECVWEGGTSGQREEGRGGCYCDRP